MVNPRVPETSAGIQGKDTVENYNLLQKRLKDNGWIPVKDIIKRGIDKGSTCLRSDQDPGM